MGGGKRQKDMREKEKKKEKAIKRKKEYQNKGGSGKKIWVRQKNMVNKEGEHELPGGPVVRTPCFHCESQDSVPGGELSPHMLCNMAKKKGTGGKEEFLEDTGNSPAEGKGYPL